MNRWSVIVMGFWVSLGAQVGCGDTDDESQTGVAKSKRLKELTAEERAALCDFAAAKFGGYDKEIECGDGLSLSSTESQAECVGGATWATCEATVGDTEACVTQQSCSNPIPAACLALFQCGGVMGGGV